MEEQCNVRLGGLVCDVCNANDRARAADNLPDPRRDREHANLFLEGAAAIERLTVELKSAHAEIEDRAMLHNHIERDLRHENEDLRKKLYELDEKCGAYRQEAVIAERFAVQLARKIR